jgi:hypothetical protein
MNDFKIGDWVVVMTSMFVALELDASTYTGMPCVIREIREDGYVILDSPLKTCYGKPPIDKAPISQLLKTTEEYGRKYCDYIFSIDTYEITRTRGDNS